MESFERSKGEPINEEPQSLLKQLRDKSPDRGLEASAVEELGDEAQIKEFFKEYTEDLKASGLEDPEDIAKKNMAYIIRYFDKKIQNKWNKALPELSFTEEDQKKFKEDEEKASQIPADTDKIAEVKEEK